MEQGPRGSAIALTRPLLPFSQSHPPWRPEGKPGVRGNGPASPRDWVQAPQLGVRGGHVPGAQGSPPAWVQSSPRRPLPPRARPFCTHISGLREAVGGVCEGRGGRDSWDVRTNRCRGTAVSERYENRQRVFLWLVSGVNKPGAARGRAGGRWGQSRRLPCTCNRLPPPVPGLPHFLSPWPEAVRRKGAGQGSGSAPSRWGTGSGVRWGGGPNAPELEREMSVERNASASSLLCGCDGTGASSTKTDGTRGVSPRQAPGPARGHTDGARRARPRRP